FSYFFLDLLDLDEEAGMIQKSTNQTDQNENAEEQANDESTNQTLMPDFMKPAHDQYAYRHANGLCVIGLAPSHIAFKDEGGITAIDFNVGKSDRNRIKVTGKQKKKLEMQLLNPLLWFRSQFLWSWRKFGRGNWRFYRIFLQPNSNVDLTEIASFPTFDGLLNSAVLSQPNSAMAHLPPRKSITSTNIVTILCVYALIVLHY
ncbi:hypothetical protein GYH30_004195, partial [Glycine max]